MVRLAPGLGWPRLRALTVLLLLVLLVHLWLIGRLWPSPGKALGQDPAGARAAPARALQLLPAAPALSVAQTVLPVPAQAAPARAPQRTRAVRADQASLPPSDERPVEAAATTVTQARQTGRAADGAADAADVGDRVDDADAEPVAPGQPPPVYPTRVPPPVVLNYSLRMNEQVGQARLVWQHQDGRYQLSLSAWGPGGPWLEQRSEGGFDAAGLAPERFIDRRRGRGWRSANFQRERGLISFSGPRQSYPAWPGAQDRLSWIAQLAAIMAATGSDKSLAPAPDPTQALPGVAATPLDIFVVDARGLGDVWQLQAGAAQALGTTLGPVQAQPWQREPPRPEGLRVQAWLDPARGHWPVLLRLTALRSGAVFELKLSEEPGLPP